MNLDMPSHVTATSDNVFGIVISNMHLRMVASTNENLCELEAQTIVIFYLCIVSTVGCKWLL